MKQIARRLLNAAFLARHEMAESQVVEAAQTETSAMTPLSLDQLKNIAGGDTPTPSPKGTW